jgi:hypothetical protein
VSPSNCVSALLLPRGTSHRLLLPLLPECVFRILPADGPKEAVFANHVYGRYELVSVCYRLGSSSAGGRGSLHVRSKEMTRVQTTRECIQLRPGPKVTQLLIAVSQDPVSNSSKSICSPNSYARGRGLFPAALTDQKPSTVEHPCTRKANHSHRNLARMPPPMIEIPMDSLMAVLQDDHFHQGIRASRRNSSSRP